MTTPTWTENTESFLWSSTGGGGEEDGAAACLFFLLDEKAFIEALLDVLPFRRRAQLCVFPRSAFLPLATSAGGWSTACKVSSRMWR